MLNRFNRVWLLPALFVVGLVLTQCASPLVQLGQASSGASQDRALATNNLEFTANVMAPLKVTDWAGFDSQLTTVKNYGVNAVSVDVWWGDVETSDNVFNWTYYDQLFADIKAHGLQIVPIFSFHQCGGNVGDTYTSLLPSWLWTKYTGSVLNGITLDANGLKHKSEQGHYSNETVQGWADSLVLGEYTAFAQNFASHYNTFLQNNIIEINVSLGPAGELRYPSYNSQDNNTGYPTRGALQMYSPLAIKDFQNKMQTKYGTIAALNTAWGTSLASFSAVQPPSDANAFFNSGDYKNIKYGKDLIDWYNQSLVDHGKNMVNAVVSGLGTTFPSAKIGYKIPGVHWAMVHPTYPRAAEVAAGLIQTSIDMNADATGHGYQNIVGLAKNFTTGGRSVVLHFTCLEMDDSTGSPAYSQAKSLVFWVANNAAAQNVTIKGENALSGGVTGDAGWNNINNAFDFASYTGLTALRIGDVASGTGQTRFGQFISKYRSTRFPSLFIRGTNNAWGTTAMVKNGAVWTGCIITFGSTASEAFKFDVYGDWSKSYGGTGLSGTAVLGGGNIAVAANGVYKITFNESTLAYAVTTVSNVITLKMTKDVGAGNSLYFSGSAPGLSLWYNGLQGTWTTGNIWVVSIVNPGNFTWKVRKGATGAGATSMAWENDPDHTQANLWPAFNGGF